MNKIKDKLLLTMVAGILGDLALTISDEIFLRLKVSKRSFREIAASIFVGSKREATSKAGSLLGQIASLFLSFSGVLVMLYAFSKSGRKYAMTKGIMLGTSFGCIIPAFLSALPINKVRPTDASSNLSYIFSHSIFGIVTALAVTKLGDESLFDTELTNSTTTDQPKARLR